MEFHAVANIFPLLEGEEFAGLVEDIRQNGQIEPIWTYQGKIIDGRNRYRACKELGIEPKLRAWSGQGSLVQFVLSLNLHRRHLSSSQKAVVAVDILPMLEEEAKERQRQAGGDKKSEAYKTESVKEIIPEPILNTPAIQTAQSRDVAAQITGTNSRYVSDAKRIASSTQINR